MKYKYNDKIKFDEEKQPYRIRACDQRYLICTKPYNPKHTVIYTIVDLKENVRGAEDLIFGAGAETITQCEAMLKRLQTGETKISHRNRVPFNNGGDDNAVLLWTYLS